MLKNISHFIKRFSPAPVRKLVIYFIQVFFGILRISKNLKFALRGFRVPIKEPGIETVVLKRELSDQEQVVFDVVESAIANSKNNFIQNFRIRKLEGMSGQNFRYLLNQFVRNVPSGDYLEVGVWKGSTAISALWNNKKHAILVDNWSEFDGPKKQAAAQIKKFINLNRFNLLDLNFKDFYNIPPKNKIGVYFYDGGHSHDEHKMAVKLIDKLNFDVLIFIVDDYNWESVQIATQEGLQALKPKLVASWRILPSEQDVSSKFGSWHNGCLIALISNSMSL